MHDTADGRDSGINVVPSVHERTNVSGQKHTVAGSGEGVVTVCPACDTPTVSRIVDPERAGTDKTYRCGTCTAKFDEPDERERHRELVNDADTVLERAFGVDRAEANRRLFGEDSS